MKERLPEDARNVLTYGEYGFVIAYRDVFCNGWEPIWKDQETDTPYLLDCTITHWMPLPDPPNSDNNTNTFSEVSGKVTVGM